MPTKICTSGLFCFGSALQGSVINDPSLRKEEARSIRLGFEACDL